MDPQQPPNTLPDEGIFTTFFMAGFECSTFIWKDGQRKDYVALTGHDRHLRQDYSRVMDLGIGVVREAIRWPLVDQGDGRYDWSSVEPVLETAGACRVTPIWDLCHYGFPDGLDPFSHAGRDQFIRYCEEAAALVCRRTPPPHFFTPVNEITFFSGAATDMGWMYPFARGRYDEFKLALCRMAIEGVKAIRRVDPQARMVHVDPLIYEVPPEDRPDLADDAWRDTYDKAFEGWDILYGRLHPELGGSPQILDIVGVNVYNFSQAELAMGGKREILAPQDPRRKPLSEMLMYAWERYHRPLIIGETSGWQDHRAEWLRDTMEECLRALVSGVDLQGVCLYPCVDIPDWNTGEWAQIGIFDIVDRETHERCPCDAYIEELRRWQKVLDRPDSLEPDAVGGGLGRVQLSEVRAHAEEWARSSGVPKVRGGMKQAA